jgi:hypothetical protein
LRIGFLAVVFLAAMPPLVVFHFAFVDRFLVAELFFFAGPDADFAFSFYPVIRFLVALIAAPESAPIMVPALGSQHLPERNQDCSRPRLHQNYKAPISAWRVDEERIQRRFSLVRPESLG